MILLFFSTENKDLDFSWELGIEREKTAIKLNERGINEQKKEERIFLLLVSSFSSLFFLVCSVCFLLCVRLLCSRVYVK